jgi:SAM-dependent methyltransferase
LEFDFERASEAAEKLSNIVQAAGEALPYPAESFDLALSHEVIEHVANDRRAITEMVRVLKPGGRLVLFAPNRGYPFETHGVYWRGQYRFGNIPLVNYLPMPLRNRLAPHVRTYTRRSLAALFAGLTVRIVQRRTIFGAYDNLIARFGLLGRLLRWLLQRLEHTPLNRLGLSHFWVVEKLS